MWKPKAVRELKEGLRAQSAQLVERLLQSRNEWMTHAVEIAAAGLTEAVSVRDWRETVIFLETQIDKLIDVADDDDPSVPKTYSGRAAYLSGVSRSNTSVDIKHKADGSVTQNISAPHPLKGEVVSTSHVNSMPHSDTM